LSRLELDQPLSLKQLASSFDLDLSTIHRQVAPLLRQGLVEYVLDPDGGRARKLQPPEAASTGFITIAGSAVGASTRWSAAGAHVTSHTCTVCWSDSTGGSRTSKAASGPDRPRRRTTWRDSLETHAQVGSVRPYHPAAAIRYLCQGCTGTAMSSEAGKRGSNPAARRIWFSAPSPCAPERSRAESVDAGLK
jgi:IclR helix-turn-helix domain